jgi:hypothetical protein
MRPVGDQFLQEWPIDIGTSLNPDVPFIVQKMTTYAGRNTSPWRTSATYLLPSQGFEWDYVAYPRLLQPMLDSTQHAKGAAVAEGGFMLDFVADA